MPIIFHLTSFWKRLAAWLIDYIFINILISMLLRLISQVAFLQLHGFRPFRFPLSRFGPYGLGFFNLSQGIIWAIRLIYEVYFLSTNGQTIGKIILKIVVVSESGHIIKPGQALIRTIIRVIPLESLLFFFTPKKQCLHDMLAKTAVVDKLKAS